MRVWKTEARRACHFQTAKYTPSYTHGPVRVLYHVRRFLTNDYFVLLYSIFPIPIPFISSIYFPELNRKLDNSDNQNSFILEFSLNFTTDMFTLIRANRVDLYSSPFSVLRHSNLPFLRSIHATMQSISNRGL